MRVLVIGGTSFIGRYAVERIVRAGHEVTVFHRGKTDHLKLDAVRHIFGERDDIMAHAEDLRAVRPDVVLDMIAHEAAHATTLLDVMKPVKPCFVVISSINIYAAFACLTKVETRAVSPTPLSEDAALRQVAISGDDKRAVEDAYLGCSWGTTILRLPLVYGPGDPQHRLYDLARRLHDGRAHILIESKLSSLILPRDHVVNVAEAIVLAIEDVRSSNNRTFNVAEPKQCTERNWIESTAEAQGLTTQVVTRPNDQLPKHLRHDLRTEHSLEVCTNRIRKELGYAEVIPQALGIRETIAWEIANPPNDVVDYASLYQLEDACLRLELEP